ncbi:hypothetical protein AQ611_00320 [Burkholderia singularis]|nr:hypothetical protein AQ611_00320 [Burkholderia sp. Bp7605]
MRRHTPRADANSPHSREIPPRISLITLSFAPHRERRARPGAMHRAGSRPLAADARQIAGKLMQTVYLQ